MQLKALSLSSKCSVCFWYIFKKKLSFKKYLVIKNRIVNKKENFVKPLLHLNYCCHRVVLRGGSSKQGGSFFTQTVVVVLSGLESELARNSKLVSVDLSTVEGTRLESWSSWSIFWWAIRHPLFKCQRSSCLRL